MSETKPLLIISVILLLASVFLFYFIVTPLLEDNTSQEKRIEKLQYELDNTTDYFNEVKENSERLDNVGWDEIEKKIDANFMSGPFFVYNMKNYLETLVLGSGLYLKELTIEGISETFAMSDSQNGEINELKEVSIDINASGSYESFEKFLKTVSNQVAIINIDSVSIDSEDGGILNFNISGNIYSE